MPEARKLAIILFADIAGYSAMMQQDEVHALHLLDKFKEVLEEEMRFQFGEIVQYFGDGCLLSFDSAFHSLEAAIALQKGFIESGVPVRIGMHLGDVVFKNNNAFGDGVNIASRVESLGVPGSILFSKSIQEQIKNKTDFHTQSLGSFHFKNIAEPMEVFALANTGFYIPKREEMRGKLEKTSPKEIDPTDKMEWERFQMLEILDSLEDEKCVLILGNYAFSRPASDQDEFFLPDLIKLQQEKWEGTTTSEQSDDFFTAAQSLIGRAGGQRMFMELTDIKLKDLGPKQKERFRYISEIPFDLILSTHPFDLIHEAFQDNHIDHHYAFYSFLEENHIPESFSAAQPLIYNLFGSVREKESMVISLDRLYQFIFGVMGVRQLPKLIQDKVQQANHLVFLGFPFDDWYMKLLLRVLKVHEKDISYAHPPAQAGLQQKNRKFFESNFKLTFLDKQIDEFVSSLHKHCEKAGLLRIKNLSEDTSTYATLRNMISESYLGEVLDTLDDIIIKDGKEGKLLRDLGDLQWTYHKIRKWENYESFSREELQEKWKEFKQSLFQFIDMAEVQIPVAKLM